MTAADIAEFTGLLIGLFGIGFTFGYILMAFHQVIKLNLPNR